MNSVTLRLIALLAAVCVLATLNVLAAHWNLPIQSVAIGNSIAALIALAGILVKTSDISG